MLDAVISEKKAFIKWGLAIASVIIVYMIIPENESITYEMRMFIAVTLFAIELMAMDLIDMLLLGLMLPGLYLVLGVAPANIVYSSWINNMIFMIVGAFVLSNIMEDVGLLRRIAYYLLKLAGGSFIKLVYILFAVCLILNFMTFTNSYIIMATLILGVCKTLGYNNISKEACVLFTVGYLGNITTKTYIYFPGYNGLMQDGLNAIVDGYTVYWYTNFLYNWPMILFSLLFIFGMCKVLKVNDSTVKFEGGKEYFTQMYNSLGKITLAEKKTAVVFCMLLIFLLTSPLHGYAVDYAFMLMPILLYLPGVNVGTESAIRRCNYRLLFFIAACLSIGKVGSALEVTSLLAEFITPLLSGKGTVFILFFSYIFGSIANVFMTPVAILAAFTAPLVDIATQFNIAAMTMTMCLLTSVDELFLPYESGSALAYCGFGVLAMNKIAKVFVIKLIFYSLFVLVVLIPYWLLIL